MRSVIIIAAATVATAALAGCTQPPAETKAFENELLELGRIGSTMIDGDDCLDLVTPRSAELMFRKDPRDPWAGADNYEVDHTTFVRVKKLLIRLGRVAEFPVDCNLWMVCKHNSAKVQMLIRQMNKWSLFYYLGQMHIDPTTQMKRVLTTGEAVVVTRPKAKPPLVSVLSPIRTNLGDVVGFLEICAPSPPR